MIKEVYKLNGQVINIGPWDYQYEQVMIAPAVLDEAGHEIVPAVYEPVARNPLPAGATVEELDCTRDADGAWRVTGAPVPQSETERLRAEVNELTLLLGDLILGGA